MCESAQLPSSPKQHLDPFQWQDHLPSPPRQSTGFSSAHEVVRRRWQVGLSLLRAPLFSVTIEAGARGVGRGLARLPRWSGGPLVGAAYGWVVDLLCYCVTEYYFYTAGS